jgi:hypothetical protein
VGHITGTISLEGVRIAITKALAGCNVGLNHSQTGYFSVHFGQLCLGTVELKTESFAPAPDLSQR